MKKTYLIGLFLTTTSLLLADVTPTININILKQNIELGFSNTTGNTKTLNLNSKYDMTYTTKGFHDKKLEFEMNVLAFITENEEVRDNEEYRTHLEVKQFFGEKFFGYTSFDWLRNKFLNFDNRYLIGVGVGKEIFNTETQNLKVKLGIAHNMEEWSVSVDGVEEKTFTSLTQYIEYNLNLNKASKFYTKLGISENIVNFSKDYDLIATMGMNFQVAEDISITLEEEVRYDSLPATPEKTNTKSMVKIGYKF